MRRRSMLALMAAAAAAPRTALAADVVSLDKLFPFLTAYLKLPFSDRSHFYLAYRAYRDKHPVADVKASILAPGGAHIPIGFDRQGIVTRLPDLALLTSGAQVAIESAPFQLGPELRCAIAPSNRIDVGELNMALVQVNKDVVKFAGALSFVVPKFTTAYFPDAGGAQAALADGRTAPLPTYTFPQLGPVAYIEPAAMATARSVMFARPPSRILLGGHPKKT
ncbi:MAG TPA: hypothetical protein VMT68_00400 [Caulobacteraceae bacterium]|nr:hypothetical protein [Caulobacteraceae bacterium]